MMIYPNDASGDLLRRMETHGEDLTKPRNIDFAGVFAEKTSAEQEHAAITLRNATDPVFLTMPVQLEAKRINVILGGCRDIADRDLRNCLGEVGEHVHQRTLICFQMPLGQV